MYWPIKLNFSLNARWWSWFTWHGWEIGATGLERLWFGWTFHLGPIKVMFGSKKRKMMTLEEYDKWLRWYCDYYQEWR
jgi:hypothetical protein